MAPKRQRVPHTAASLFRLVSNAPAGPGQHSRLSAAAGGDMGWAAPGLAAQTPAFLARVGMGGRCPFASVHWDVIACCGKRSRAPLNYAHHVGRAGLDAGAFFTSAQLPRLAIQLPKAALPLKRRHGGRRRSRQRQCRPDRCTAGFVVSPKGHPLMCKMWIHTIPSRDPRGQGFGARPRCAQMRTLSLPCRPQAPGGHAPHHDTFVGACQLPGLGHPGLNHLAEGRQPPPRRRRRPPP